MMDKVLFSEDFSCNNILYIGDNAKDCLAIIEKFTGRLRKIGESYAALFSLNQETEQTDRWLQHHIQYHFEGGVAVFKFRNEEGLPAAIRKECQLACRNLAFEQVYFAS
jgi:hypothetical protein